MGKSKNKMKKLFILMLFSASFMPCMAQYTPTVDTMHMVFGEERAVSCEMPRCVIAYIPASMTNVVDGTISITLWCDAPYDDSFFWDTAYWVFDIKDKLILDLVEHLNQVPYEVWETMFLLEIDITISQYGHGALAGLFMPISIPTFNVGELEGECSLSLNFASPNVIWLCENNVLYSILWSTGDTTLTTTAPAGDCWVMVMSPCGDTVVEYFHYDGIGESYYKEPFFSQFSNQICLLEDGELELYNALGQKLLGTREREFYLSTPGLYILRFRSVSGAIRTAKIVW